MPDDEQDELVRRIADGDAAAMRAVVALHLPKIMALATRMLGVTADAEDVAQETFLRIWKNAGGWQGGKAQFSTWIHRVALNLCYDKLRRKHDISMEDPPDMVDDRPLPDARLLADDVPGDRVERALQAIAARQREAIVLVYYQGLSNIVAANLMAISVDALESLLARGRRSLQTLLIKDEDNG